MHLNIKYKFETYKNDIVNYCYFYPKFQLKHVGATVVYPKLKTRCKNHEIEDPTYSNCQKDSQMEKICFKYPKVIVKRRTFRECAFHFQNKKCTEHVFQNELNMSFEGKTFDINGLK